MVFIRLLVLGFFVAYSFSMGGIPGDQLNWFGKFMATSFFVFAPALYFLPLFEAGLEKHPSTTAIGLLNLCLGWTVIGWVGALVWAKSAPARIVEVAATPQQIKTCPMCAESVLAAARICKHCGHQFDQDEPRPNE